MVFLVHPIVFWEIKIIKGGRGVLWVSKGRGRGKEVNMGFLLWFLWL